MWGIWGSYIYIPKAIFYLLEGDYKGSWVGELGELGFEAQGLLLEPSRRCCLHDGKGSKR